MKELLNAAFIKKITQMYGMAPTKSRGQNFLIDRNILDKIIDAADISDNDYVVEIGPGLGVLTLELAKKAKNVLAVELDKKVADILSIHIENIDNIELAVMDALSDEFYEQLTKWIAQHNISEYKIVANIPYNITSRIIRHFLEMNPGPSDMVLMIQKEVALRMKSQEGSMNMLALSVQHLSTPEIVTIVSKNSFWPIPNVDSAVIALRNIPQRNDEQIRNDKLLFALARMGFAAKRKMLKKNLANHPKLTAEIINTAFSKLGINEKARAQELSLKTWTELTKILAQYINT